MVYLVWTEKSCATSSIGLGLAIGLRLAMSQPSFSKNNMKMFSAFPVFSFQKRKNQSSLMHTAPFYLVLVLLTSQFSPIALFAPQCPGVMAHPMPAMPVMDIMSTYKLNVVPIFKRGDLKLLTPENAIDYGLVYETAAKAI